MNRLRQLILTFILLWIAVKMAFFFTGNAQEGMVISVFLNLLFILLVEFFALQFKYKTITLDQSNFLIDMKDCVKAGATYVVFVVLFLVCYYYLIHPELFQGQIEDRVALAIEQSSDREYFEELKRQNVNQICGFEGKKQFSKKKWVFCSVVYVIVTQSKNYLQATNATRRLSRISLCT